MPAAGPQGGAEGTLLVTYLTVDYFVGGSRAGIVLDGSARIDWNVDGGAFTARTGDFALLAALPKAMTENRPLHLRGRADRETMRNARLLSHFWSQWCPTRYSPIDITADEVTENDALTARKSGYVMCLSGGVDSTFAYLSTVKNDNQEMRYEIPLAVFVQGFDYKLEDDAGFTRTLEKSVRQISDGFDTTIVAVKTNWKQELCGHYKAEWEHMANISLAAVLHLLGGGYAGGLIASDYTYHEDHLVAPWGSNATTNRMLGSSEFPILPVGEQASRLEKIRAIHEWGKLAAINVCWAGPRTGENCARCEKCVRTMLMCEALGIDPTDTFGRRPAPSDVVNLNLSSAGKIAFIRQAIALEGGRLSPEMKRAAAIAIAKSQARNWALPRTVGLRKVVRTLRPWLKI